MSANMANSAIHHLEVDKWVVSWTQAYAMPIRVVAPPEECLRVKTDMVLFAGDTVWSISERVRGVREDALYKSTLPLPLPPQRGPGRGAPVGNPFWRIWRPQNATFSTCALSSSECRVSHHSWFVLELYKLFYCVVVYMISRSSNIVTMSGQCVICQVNVHSWPHNSRGQCVPAKV